MRVAYALRVACGSPLNKRVFESRRRQAQCVWHLYSRSPAAPPLNKRVFESTPMIHGYHVILPAYGFWLPNDPRGSWSEFVRRWELVRFGQSTKYTERRDIDELSLDEIAQREAARA